MTPPASACDWLSRLLLPGLHAKIAAAGHSTLAEFFQATRQLLGNEGCGAHLAAEPRLQHACAILEHLADVEAYALACAQAEAQLVYVAWLAGLARPLVLTVLVSLFLLPGIAVVLLCS